MALFRSRSRENQALPAGWLAFILAAGCWPPLPARDRDLHYTITGEEAFDDLGWRLAPLGDVDGDGAPDFAAAARQFRVDATGKVLVISGRSGETLRTLLAGSPGVRYGSSMGSGGDFDGDPTDDLLIQGTDIVELRSPRTGELIHVLRDPKYSPFALQLTGVGDIDGDDRDDFAIGLPREVRRVGAGQTLLTDGSVTVHSGRTAEVLWERRGEEPDDAFGVAVEPLGDIDGDGVPDLAVGMAGHRTGEPRPGKLYVLSGIGGETIYTRTLGLAGDGYSRHLAVLGDVNGDGLRDIAVGAANYPLFGVGGRGAGRVDVLSGAGGELIWSVLGQDFDRLAVGEFFRGDILGAELENAGDADGDGADDLLIYAGRAGFGSEDSGRAYLRSGRDGRLLAAYESERDHTAFGDRFARVGDIDGDGRSEFAISASFWEAGDPLLPHGRVYVLGYTGAGPRFVRGDANGDGNVNISDAVAILNHLYLGGPAECLEAMDADRSRRVDISDPIVLIRRLILGGRAPQPPYPDCGHFVSFRPQLSCEESSCR